MYRLMDEVAALRSDGEPYAVTATRALAIARGEATATPAEIDAMNLVPDEYRGLDRYEARDRVVADIDAEGLMIGVEDKLIMQPFGDRGGVVIEPMLTDQWYVDAKTLAQPPLDAVRDGRIEIVPKTWEKDLLQLDGEHPAVVRLAASCGGATASPHGYDTNGNDLSLATTESRGAGRWPARTSNWRRTPTCSTHGFRRALWPFATLGWPDVDAPLLHPKHYPNDLLISGFDILFFWDARMAMHGDAAQCSAKCRGSGSTCTDWCAPPTGRRCPSQKATWSIRSA